MLCRFTFSEAELFFIQNFMFINEFNKPRVHWFFKYLTENGQDWSVI